MRKHDTDGQRTALVELVTTGQATPRAAAAQLGVTESTAYYWLKCARKRPALAVVRQVAHEGSATRSRPAAPTFARLLRATEAPSRITLRVAGTEIEVRSGFDPALLRDVISALVEEKRSATWRTRTRCSSGGCTACTRRALQADRCPPRVIRGMARESGTTRTR